MANTLYDLLQRDEPTALPRIERALLSQDDLSGDQEAILGALVWTRCTSGGVGLLGCVLHQDCAKRIEVLPSQLERIGAARAAQATDELRSTIPLDDTQIKHGLADWIDTQPDIIIRARELDDGLENVDQHIWDFMKDAASDIPDIEVPTRTGSVVSSMLGFFRSPEEE